MEARLIISIFCFSVSEIYIEFGSAVITQQVWDMNEALAVFLENIDQTSETDPNHICAQLQFNDAILSKIFANGDKLCYLALNNVFTNIKWSYYVNPGMDYKKGACESRFIVKVTNPDPAKLYKSITCLPSLKKHRSYPTLKATVFNCQDKFYVASTSNKNYYAILNYVPGFSKVSTAILRVVAILKLEENEHNVTEALNYFSNSTEPKNVEKKSGNTADKSIVQKKSAAVSESTASVMEKKSASVDGNKKSKMSKQKLSAAEKGKAKVLEE